jgi:hypothetical protein
MILRFIDLVLSGPVSQRAAASVLRLVAKWSDGDNARLPCANSGRLWMVRLGLYSLRCEKERADDWLWIMDHTVQLGPRKCFVIVGIRVSVWQSLERPLCHQDLSLLNLTPMLTANKQAVAEQLQQTYSQMGRPAAVLSDEGAELKSGMQLFQQQLVEADIPQPPHLHDIKHKAATFLKKELETTDTWASFVKQLTRTRLNVTLTSLAFLNPPRLRNKARFMNLDGVVNWGARALKFLKAPRDFPEERIDLDQLEAKLAWLREFEQPLQAWEELLTVIEAAEKYVRCEGYHHGARNKLAQVLQPLAQRPSSQPLKTKLLDFVEQESQKLKPGQRVLGHTEILESLLGKYKQIQGRHSQGGMTASLLNLGAAVLNRTPEVVQQALQAVPVQAIYEWVRQNLGQTIASKQKTALG